MRGDDRVGRVLSHSWKRESGTRASPERALTSSPSVKPDMGGGCELLIMDRILQQRKVPEVLSEDRRARCQILGYQDVDVLDPVSEAPGPLFE